MKPRSFAFHDTCWDVPFLLVWPCDRVSLCDFLIKRFITADLSDLWADEDGFAGWSECYEGTHVVALAQWTNSTQDIGVLSHECSHAAMGALFAAGVEILPGNEEPLAYLQESLLRRCLERLRRR